MKPKSFPKQARKWIEELLCWFQMLRQHFMFLSCCIYFHACSLIFLSFACMFLLLCIHVPFMFLSFTVRYSTNVIATVFMSIHCPRIVLSCSFQCALVSSHLPLICPHFNAFYFHFVFKSLHFHGNNSMISIFGRGPNATNDCRQVVA